MKNLLFFLLLVSFSVSAQTSLKSNPAKAKRGIPGIMEDSLKVLSFKMINERLASQRFMADSMFIRMFVRALKMPNSFNYPFDSLESLSHIYAPDSSFRIFSWQFSRDEDFYMQRGAIQMRTADGSLKLYPLHDVSMWTNSPQDSVRTANNWVGAIYYSMVMKSFNGKNYYTLLGFDDNNMRSTKKWIDVLTFDASGHPLFGGPFFRILSDEVKQTSIPARFCMEYKKDGKARMNFDKDLDMIVYDHLISENNHPDQPSTLIPDGDYQGFKWNNGKWVQIDKVFDYKLQDGQAPIPLPLKDASGKNNELKLMQQSEQNMQKQKQQKQPSKRTLELPPPVVPERKTPTKDREDSY